MCDFVKRTIPAYAPNTDAFGPAGTCFSIARPAPPGTGECGIPVSAPSLVAWHGCVGGKCRTLRARGLTEVPGRVPAPHEPSPAPVRDRWPRFAVRPSGRHRAVRRRCNENRLGTLSQRPSSYTSVLVRSAIGLMSTLPSPYLVKNPTRNPSILFPYRPRADY